MGFEPTHGGTTNLCLNPLATLAIMLLAFTNLAYESDFISLVLKDFSKNPMPLPQDGS